MNGRVLALTSVAALAAGAALSRAGSPARDFDADFDADPDDETAQDRAYANLVARGGTLDTRDGFTMLGPSPLRRLILTDVADADGDPGVWINWIEGTPGSSGAWRLVEEILVESGVRFAAGETSLAETWRGWKKRGFHRISRVDADAMYFDVEPGNFYFRKDLLS